MKQATAKFLTKHGVIVAMAAAAALGVGAAMLIVSGVAATSSSAHAEEFNQDEYDRYSVAIVEANGACRGINDLAGCVSAYLCTNYGMCENENRQPIETTPGGSVYRENGGLQ